MRRGSLLSWLFVGALMVFLFAPVVVVVLFAFNAGTSTAPPLTGLSLRWFEQIFTTEDTVEALRNSAIAAVATAIFSVVAGTGAALAMLKLSPRTVAAFSGLFAAPLIVPSLFIGVALLSFLSRIGFELSLNAVIVGHVVLAVPLVFALMSARLARLDLSIMEAARDLGATGPQAFVRVLLPLIAPVIVAASLLSLAWSVDEFIISLFVNGGDETVPVVIFGSLREGLDPAVNALASTILAVTVVATLLAGKAISVRDIAR